MRKLAEEIRFLIAWTLIDWAITIFPQGHSWQISLCEWVIANYRPKL
jgi:hypothetical protein